MALIEDANELVELKAQCQKAGIHFGRYLETYEIMNYYVVGFITCLEWHARSRLVDLMVHNASCIEAKDVKNLDKDALSQMMSEQVTVPYLVGAATSVSSLSDYIEIFNRVFRDLDNDVKVEALLRSTNYTFQQFGEETTKSLFEVLTDLFQSRHDLVHEIGFHVVCHFSLRDLWPVERPNELGGAVIQCMQIMDRLRSSSHRERFQTGWTPTGARRMKRRR